MSTCRHVTPFPRKNLVFNSSTTDVNASLSICVQTNKFKGLVNDDIQIKASFSQDGMFVISGSEDGQVTHGTRFVLCCATRRNEAQSDKNEMLVKIRNAFLRLFIMLKPHPREGFDMLLVSGGLLYPHTPGYVTPKDAVEYIANLMTPSAPLQRNVTPACPSRQRTPYFSTIVEGRRRHHRRAQTR